VSASPPEHASAGPLTGVRIVEVAGIGPGPFAAMMLGDMGAEVLRIERTVPSRADAGIVDGILRRNRSAVAVLDLKAERGRDALLRIVESADALIEGFRPGVAERLGVGPEVCLARNPRLVYGRMTGWGQDGPLATRAGHDITYLALTGALHAVGRPGERPAPPLNLVGDFGGGSMLLLTGVLAALWERERSGRGQVVDAAMVDGVGLLLQSIWSLRGMGLWTDERGSNVFDGHAPYYDTYACADGRFVAVGALEPQFWAELLGVLGLSAEDLPDRQDRTRWPELRERLAAVFATRTRDAWTAAFAGTDACVTPVLRFDEVAAQPHAAARGSVITLDDVPQAAPAPRFSRTPPPEPTPPPTHLTDPEDVLADWR
jgi:alpha-methylacyl-CoA racemase